MKTCFPLLFVLLTFSTSADNVTTRFTPPAGYGRVKAEPGSFGEYLQNIALKPAGTHTKTYLGNIAATDAYTAAVLDVSVGKQDLQQCADAVMRLRAEYLYHQKNYNAISFKFTGGFVCDFNHYAKGYRYAGDKWVLKGKPGTDYPTFLRYMDLVFSYAGTLSLEKELKPVTNAAELKTGDVFIHGGSPGHCFIVMDMAENAAHNKVFLLAQSYMPAQDIQVLQNDSPWFSLDKKSLIPYGMLVDMKYLRRFD